MSELTIYNAKLRKGAMSRTLKARKMREAGATWAEIGAALGVSRQRAQQLASRPA